jgi:hypothetical protein
MLSWIFRNRLRLSKIYGPAPAPALAGSRFHPAENQGEQRGTGPGRLWATRRFLWVRPMSRRAAGPWESSKPGRRA